MLSAFPAGPKDRILNSNPPRTPSAPPLNFRRIACVGLPGSGKSTVGRHLARRIGWGASPRGSIALERCARARAWLAGRDVAIPSKAGLQGAELEAMERLIDDLASTKYTFADRSGKIQIESKKEMRARTGRSPDAGDSLILTFAGSAVGAQQGRKGGVSWNQPVRRNLKGIV